MNFSLLQQQQTSAPPLLPLDSCGKSATDRRSSFETRIYWRFKEVVEEKVQEEDKNKLPSPQLIDPKEDCIDTPRASSFFPRPHFTHPRHPRHPPVASHPACSIASSESIPGSINAPPRTNERQKSSTGLVVRRHFCLARETESSIASGQERCRSVISHTATCHQGISRFRDQVALHLLVVVVFCWSHAWLATNPDHPGLTWNTDSPAHLSTQYVYSIRRPCQSLLVVIAYSSHRSSAVALGSDPLPRGGDSCYCLSTPLLDPTTASASIL